jgi:hypothetical protein
VARIGETNISDFWVGSAPGKWLVRRPKRERNVKLRWIVSKQIVKIESNFS